MRLQSYPRRPRRGMSAVQWCLIVGAVVLALVGGMSVMGTSVRDDLTTTAGDVADPSQLKNRFGSGS